MKIFKNIILLVAVLILSYFTANYFGTWYDKFSPQYGGSFFNFSKESALFVAGIPVAYVFFTIFIFGLFGFKEKKNWIITLLIPPALLWLLGDKQHIYIPIILGLIAYGFSKILRIGYLKVRG